jgi:hypothetical protein
MFIVTYLHFVKFITSIVLLIGGIYVTSLRRTSRLPAQELLLSANGLSVAELAAQYR